MSNPPASINIDRNVGNFFYDLKPTRDGGVGLTEQTIDYIVDVKGEPDWIREFRKNAYRVFKSKPLPTHWAGDELKAIDFGIPEGNTCHVSNWRKQMHFSKPSARTINSNCLRPGNRINSAPSSRSHLEIFASLFRTYKHSVTSRNSGMPPENNYYNEVILNDPT